MLYCLIITAVYVLLIALLVAGVLMLSFPKNRHEQSQGEYVSVVVAFRNEAENIQNLIDALNHQTLPPTRWEAIFVDDGSSDSSADAVKRAGWNIRYVKLNGRTGKKQAIIKGVSVARYNIVALTDADCIPAATWLQGVLANIGGRALVQGSVNVVPNKSVVSHFEALDYASLMAASAGSFALGGPIIASASNMAFRKNLIEVSAKTLKARYASGDDMFLLHEAKRLLLPTGFIASNLADVTTHFDGGFLQMVQRRKRWASKANGYTDLQTIVAAIVVLLMNLLIVVK